MNVRWKPLLILSGLFFFTALAGAGVWIFGFGAGSGMNPEAILVQARQEREAGQFDRALIQYRRAIQASGGVSAPIQEEIAEMYSEQLKTAPAENRDELFLNRLRALAEAARLDRTRAQPRRVLMQESLALGEEIDAIRWAEELIALEPKDADANYLVGLKSLDRNAQDLNKARQYIQELAKLEPNSPRVDYLTVELNQESGQPEKNEPIFKDYLTKDKTENLSESQKLAWCRLRIRAADHAVSKTPDQRIVADLISVFDPILMDPETLVIHRVEWTGKLQDLSLKLRNVEGADLLTQQVRQLIEKSLRQAIEANKNDLLLQFAMAKHLMSSGNYDACVSIVNAALELPESKRATSLNLVMQLRDLAVKSLLANTENQDRFEQVQPHIQAFLSAKDSRYQGLGNLFQGSIDLEKSGIGGDTTEIAIQPKPENSEGQKPEAPKTALDYRRSALAHLKKAAESLPALATSQALYGIALILNREPELGRQALQKAWKVGTPEVRYQVWTAWSQVMAGYPEDALPIVRNLMEQAEKDPSVAVFIPTLHLLMGEILQARNTPDSLQLAYQQYAKALASGKDASNAVHLRVAQLEMVLNQNERAQARLKALSNNKETAAAAQQLRIMNLIDQGDSQQARLVLNEARKANPESVELVMSDATLLSREGKFQEAIEVLSEFGQRRPEVIEVVQLQAQIMAERLGQIAEARKMVENHLVKAPNTYLQIQSVQLAIAARDFGSAQQGIAKLRSQWPDSASADILSAQLSLAQNNLPGALSHYQLALKKDPGNKLAQFWVAQIEARLGAVSSATQTFEKLVSESSSKQIDSGVTLTDASQAALASLEIDAGQADQAISRLKNLLSQGQSQQLQREYQWQLIAAYASKRDWSNVMTILETVLSLKTTTFEEKVTAANYLRSAGQQEKALKVLDEVLAADSDNSGASALKGFILADMKRFEEAAKVVRQAWKAENAPISLALLLAALENGIDPEETRLQRSEAVLDEAKNRFPESVDIIKAIYSLRRAKESQESMIAWLNETITDKSSLQCRRLKAKILAGEAQFQDADKLFADLILENPQDFSLVVDRLQALRSEISRKADGNDSEKVRSLNTQLDQLLATYRGKFPANPEIFAIEAEVAADRGQTDRALEISRKIDEMNPNSPFGPLVRLRVLVPTKQWSEIILNLEEAISRDPRRRDLKLQLADAYVQVNRDRDSLKLVDELLQAEPDSVRATLLKARLQMKMADNNTRAQQAKSTLAMLESLSKIKPAEMDVYEEAISIARFASLNDMAQSWIDRGLKQKPDDPTLVSYLIELSNGRPEFASLLSDWTRRAESESSGNLAMAISVGLQRTNRLEDALKLAKIAVTKSDSAGAWLNQGGILLNMADAAPELQRRPLLDESIIAYDKVLDKVPDSIEAVNNKAWILHHYLGRNTAASEVVEAYLKRTDSKQTPAEFDDTVGSIRESVAQVREAEVAYASGLSKSPNHAMLNYHMGRLVARDPGRRSAAVPYLEKALSSSQRLNTIQAAEAKKLLSEIQGKPVTPATLRAN